MQNTALFRDDGEAVVHRYADMIYRVALSRTGSREEAEEAFQETFLAYFRKKPTLSDEEHRKAWLLRTVMTCSKRLRSKQHAKATLPLNEETALCDAPLLPEERRAWAALLSLPEAYRVPLQLACVEELPSKEIASLLGLSDDAVRKRISRGKELMRAQLKGETE